VSEETAKRSRSHPFGPSFLRGLWSNPEVSAIALYTLFVLIAVPVAYVMIFTSLQPYDDEGTLLSTLQAFTHGQTLYRDVYSSYGPFYYEIFGGFFKLTGQEVSTDASRTIVVIVWTGASLLFGIAAHRLSKTLLVGFICATAAFAELAILTNEPMHPQGLCTLLIAGFACVAATPRTRAWAPLVAGLLLGALLMTKINLGIFAIAGVVLAAFLTIGPLYRIRWLRWLVIAGFLLLPLLILDRDLKLFWVREFVIIVGLSAAAIVVAATPLRPRPEDDDAWGMGWVRWMLAGLMIAVVAILLIIFATGPSPSDVYEGIITQAIRVRDVLVLQLSFPNAAVDWAVLSLAAAGLTAYLRRITGDRPTIWGAIGRLAAGLVIICVIGHVTIVTLNPSATEPVLIPILLAWVAAVPLPGRPEDARRRFLRVALPALAVAGALGVYPVAGSQVGIASVAFVPVGAICIGDGLSLLRAWAAADGAVLAERVRAFSTAGLAALALIFGLQALVLPGISNAIIYHDNTELPLPGAHLMRLPAASVEQYVGMVDAVHEHHCTALVGYPSFNSLYLWSGLEAPPPQLPNGWAYVLDREQQQQVVDEVKSTPRPCAYVSAQRASMYEGNGPPPELPLRHYVINGFTPVAEYGDFEFKVAKGDR
jgi:hypothetical protein